MRVELALFDLKQWPHTASKIARVGTQFENLLASGFVLRWHLLAIEQPQQAPHGFLLHEVCIDEGLKQFAGGKLRVCLEKGVYLAPANEEATVANSAGKKCVCSNSAGKPTAHHDLVIPTLDEKTSVAVQCRFGGMKSAPELAKQLTTSDDRDCYLLSVCLEHKAIERRRQDLVQAKENGRCCEIGAAGVLNPQLLVTLKALCGRCNVVVGEINQA